MRVMLVLLMLAAGAARAEDCKEPTVENKVPKGLVAFAECVNKRLAGLEKEKAQLQDRIDSLEKLISGLPGEMTDTNGRVTRSGSGALVRAVISLDARSRQAAMEKRIDQKALEQLCSEGCNVTLSLTAVGLREGDPTPIFATGPCGFLYKAKSGGWTLGQGCGTPVSGVDGDGTLSDVPGGDTIVTVGQACLFADSGPRRNVDPEDQPLSPDRDKGLFLIADPALWTGTEQRFRCDLRITK
ncbi:hypothetical protein [Rhodobacter sp. SY28-1]|uniref:hypothetical protein n=1 Tax=Rhodobacter sp. SY28-1 TaxID=2562317 RepID=UPI0010BF6A9B|nr:hypothetical protein [Rhodobacter sp. SY28-1]